MENVYPYVPKYLYIAVGNEELMYIWTYFQQIYLVTFIDIGTA